MGSLLLTVDQVLRGEGVFSSVQPQTIPSRQQTWEQFRVIALCGALYGGLMGGFGGVWGDGWKQILLSACKVPSLFLVTCVLCLPPFYVMNALAGLQPDFSRVLRALLGFQCLASIVLAAMAPLTLLMNLSSDFYGFILLWNGLIFAVASLSGHFLMSRLYRPLIQSNALHAIFLRVWIFLYTFVGIQMAWVLRPFVGSPNLSFQIFRREAWGNAYIEMFNLVLRVLRSYLH
jgi:hypothetical protein